MAPVALSRGPSCRLTGGAGTEDEVFDAAGVPLTYADTGQVPQV